jgi:hypothetical protein
MRTAAALLVAAAAAASSASEPQPQLDMLAFFAGRTHADNVIKVVLHGPHKLVVDSVGGRNKEGQFVLIDTVQEEGKPERKRVWVMHPEGPGRFTGTLSDAKGPVNVVVDGTGATITYVMQEGSLKITQLLELQRDGTLSNHVVAKKFGLKFAEVDGTIRKLD